MAISIASKKTINVPLGPDGDSIDVTFRIPTASEAVAISSQRAQAMATEDPYEKESALIEHMLSVLPSLVLNISGITDEDGAPLEWRGTDDEKQDLLNRLGPIVAAIYFAYSKVTILSDRDKKK